MPSYATAVSLGLALFGMIPLFTPAHRLLGEPERMLTRVLELPFLWILAGSVLAIGIWWAGLTATTIFALLHLPMWSWGPVATLFISGGIMAVFYIVTQDLTACMIAHTITDAVGFIKGHNAALAH